MSWRVSEEEVGLFGAQSPGKYLLYWGVTSVLKLGNVL